MEVSFDQAVALLREFGFPVFTSIVLLIVCALAAWQIFKVFRASWRKFWGWVGGRLDRFLDEHVEFLRATRKSQRQAITLLKRTHDRIDAVGVDVKSMGEAVAKLTAERG